MTFPFVGAVVRFANRLALAAEYIINHARHPMHTSLLEGINNKINVMMTGRFISDPDRRFAPAG